MFLSTYTYIPTYSTGKLLKYFRNSLSIELCQDAILNTYKNTYYIYAYVFYE